MTKRPIIGMILVFFSLVCINFCNYLIRFALIALATPGEAVELTPKPGDIASEMILASNLGFGSSVIGFVGLLLVVLGTGRQKAPEHSEVEA